MSKSDSLLPTSRQAPSPVILQGAVAIGVLSVSSAAVLIRLAPAPATQIAFWRLGLATLALAPAAVRAHPHWPFDARHWAMMGAAGVFLALHFMFWIQSLALLPVAVSTALVSTHPLQVAWIERIRNRQAFSRPVWVGMGLVMSGVLWLFGSGLTSAARLSLPGILWALGGAFFGGLYILAGHNVRQSLDTVIYAPVVYLAAMIVLAGVGLVDHQPLWPQSPRLWILYALIALIPTLGGHTLFNWLLRYVPATTISLALVGEIAGSGLLAWVVLGQLPTFGQLITIVLVGLGLTVILTPPRKANSGRHHR